MVTTGEAGSNPGELVQAGTTRATQGVGNLPKTWWAQCQAQVECTAETGAPC